VTSTVNETQCQLIARAIRLRGLVFAFNLEIGADFARDLARGWRLHRFNGMASACLVLQATLENEIGAYDLFAEARTLDGLLGAQP
jgi:hypothetical protein